NYHGQNGWLPFVEMVRGHGAGKELVPKSVHHLASCLRMAFCESVSIELIGGPEEGDAFNALCDMLFHDLVASSTFVGTLAIDTFLGSVEVIARGIEAFKSVKSVSAECTYADLDPVGEAFFLRATRRGVRNMEVKSMAQEEPGVTPTSTAAALSFGFTEPSDGGGRSLLGVECEGGSDFLAQVRQKVAELNEARYDFSFKLGDVSTRAGDSPK
ncbi:hypothetical protein AAVH_42529, partial [Aphelenchoides avenae]